MFYPEFSQSKKAEQNAITEKYINNKQIENKFNSLTPQEAENIKQLASVYSFAPAGLLSTLGKGGLTAEQSEAYIINYVNNYVNDNRTIRKNARDYQLSNAGIYNWLDKLEAAGKKAALDDKNVFERTKGNIKKFVQVASTGMAAYPQFISRILKTYTIARGAAIEKAVAQGQDISYIKNNAEYLDLNKAFTNPIFMKEFLNQIKPQYIGGKEDLTKDFVPFFEGGPAFEKAGPSALTVGFEQFGDKFFDLNTEGAKSGLGNSWFPYFGSGSEAWDESNRRGQMYAKFRGSAFSPTTADQPVTMGGLIAGEFVDANTQAYKNISGAVDGLMFVKGDLGNKLQTISQSTRLRYKNWGLIKEVGKDGVTRLRTVDRAKAFNYFMKSDEGAEIMTAWSTKLDDTNEIVKNFTPNMAQDLIKASYLKTPKQKEEAVRAAFEKWAFSDPKGKPNMPKGYKWNKTVESIGLNKIFNNLSNKEKDTARKLWGDWTPKDTFVWSNQEDVIENTRRFIINSRIPAEKGNKLLASFVNATLENTNPNIGYTNQKQVFNKILDAAAESMVEAKERPDVIESFLDITKGNLRGFSTEDVSSYWVSDILSWHNVKTAGTKLLGIEGNFPGQRSKLDEMGRQIVIDGKPQKVPTPHLSQQLLKESMTVPDMRKIRNSTGTVSKAIRNMELVYGKKIAQGIDKYFDKDLVGTGWFESSRLIDSPRLATRSLINLLWGVQKGIWTPLQLVTRLAFPVRITSDGQAKLAADGYPSLANHISEYFGLLLGKNNKTLAGEVVTKSRAFDKVSRDNTRLFLGDTTIENLKKGYLDFKITDAFQNAKLKKEYLTSVVEEIKLLNLGELTNIVANNLLNNVDEATLAKRLFRGDLDNLRLDYQVNLLGDDMTPGNALSTYEKTLAYVDTLYQRVKEISNDPAILKFIASGSDSIEIINKKGITETLKIIDVPQGSTLAEMFQVVKRKTIDDKKFYKYLEDLFDEVSPMIREEIAKEGGKPTYMGFPLIQQGRPSIKWSDTKEVTTEIKKFLDGAFTALFEFPAGIERAFNRSPLYRTVRGKAYGDGYLLLPDNLKKEFLENINKLPKMYSTKLKNDKFIKGIEKFFDLDALNKSTKEVIMEAVEEAKTAKLPEGVKMFESLDELEAFVDARALFVHNNLLFNLSERGYFADVTRLMYPFMGAYVEQVSTWTGVLSRNPFAIKKAGLFVNGAQQSGWITEGPNGEKYYSYPWIGPAVEGKYFYDQSNRIKIDASAPLNAINMVTSETGPGAGPVLQIPSGMYIPDKPEFDLIQKHFNPFGVKVTDAESLKKFGATYLIPSYMVKAITAWTEGEGIFADEYLWNTHMVQTAKALAVTGFYINDAGEIVSIMNEVGTIDQDKLLEGAVIVGTKTLLTRALNQFYLPAGFTYDYRLRTDAQLIKDYEEYFGKDVEIGMDGEGFLRFTAIQSVYSNLKTVFDGDDEAAILAMTQILGPDWLQDGQGIEPLTYLTRGSSYNEAGIRSTTEVGYDWERTNANLEEYIPNIFGLFAPAPEPGADYDYDARFAQLRKGNIVKLTAEEWATEIQKIAGSRMWSYQTMMKERELGRPLTPSEKADIFGMVDTMFPNWYVTSVTLSQDVTQWNDIELAMGIDVRGKDKLPQEILNQIKKSNLYEPLKQYMDAREETLKEIGNIKGINNKYGKAGTSQQYYLKNTEATQPYRNNLKVLGEQLAKDNAEFAIFWNLIGSKELKQEYYKDREGNIIALLEELED